jgi:hypothetical protein
MWSCSYFSLHRNRDILAYLEEAWAHDQLASDSYAGILREQAFCTSYTSSMIVWNVSNTE